MVNITSYNLNKKITNFTEKYKDIYWPLIRGLNGLWQNWFKEEWLNNWKGNAKNWEETAKNWEEIANNSIETVNNWH